MKTLTDDDFRRAAGLIGCEVAAIKAVCEVEAPGGGFDPEGDPRTLFEGHKFYAFTNGKYATSHPTLCYPKWTREFYGADWKAEKARLHAAMTLDISAAMRATSWGRFQIMGFNSKLVGFDTLTEFVHAMAESEGRQLEAFLAYVQANHLADELVHHDWAGFARGYNGAGFEANHYDTKLAAAYAKHAGSA